MQSYEHHIVRETLEMRHPCLDDGSFSPEIDPTQISVAFNDRFVAKYKDVLLNDEIETDMLSDALKTLNELAHHHETVDIMIEAGYLEIVASLLKNPYPQVRE